MTTCCSVLGLILLVITNLACLICFATPYWIIFEGTEVAGTKLVTQRNQGLWAFCEGENCQWVFEDAYGMNSKSRIDTESDWWLASVGLVCSGFGMTLFALLFATIALCCDCRGCNASHTIGGLLILGFLALGTAAVVFGVSSNKNADVRIGAFAEGTTGKKVGWSFWLDIGSAGLTLLTALIYIIDGRNKDPMH